MKHLTTPLIFVLLTACTGPLDDGAGAAPTDMSPLHPTGRVVVDQPEVIDVEPSDAPDVEDDAPEDDATVAGFTVAKCGNGRCDRRETCSSCAGDCGACSAPPTSACGDATCDGLGGEMCTTCGVDCAVTTAVCGNGACQTGETTSSCRPDCGVDPWPGTWAGYEAEVVRLINEARAAGNDCPSGPKEPIGPVTVDPLLQQAARLHSWDQSYSGYVAHTSCNGRSAYRRALDVGTSCAAEIIGRGPLTPKSIVDAWLASTSGHCDIVMGNRMIIGVGMSAERSYLWTAMFR